MNLSYDTSKSESCKRSCITMPYYIVKLAM